MGEAAVVMGATQSSTEKTVLQVPDAGGPCVSRNVSGAKAIGQRRYVKMVRSPAGVRGTGAGLHLDGKCT